MNILEARRRTLDKGVYKKTVEGNPAIAQGSLARRYPGITMQGWTEQAQYEGKNIYNGQVLESKYGGSTIDDYLDNINTNSTTPVELEPSTNYTFSINEEVGYKFDLRFYDVDGNYISSSYLSTFLTPDNTKYIIICGIKSILSVDYKIQIEKGTSATLYEPYTGGAPSPSPDYPQEIVNAGKYNEDTQKWEYEITIANAQTDPDKNQTVTLTSDRPLTKWDKLEKRNGQWGWGYKSAEVVLDGSEDENWNVTASSTYTFIININGAMFINSYCDRYIRMPAPWISNIFGVYSDNGYNTKYFRPPSADVETVEQWKTFLSQNPLTVVCETAEETFVPLSESEQEAMNALYTFRPTTVLSNDCGCNMTLTYKTKKSLEVID